MSSYVLEGQTPKKSRRLSRPSRVVVPLVAVVGLGALAGYGSWANRLPPLPPESRVYPEPNGLDRFLTVSWKLPPRLRPRDPFQAELPALRPVLQGNREHLLKLREAVALPFMTPLFRSNYRLPAYSNDVSATGWLFVVSARTERAEGRAASAMSWALDAAELGLRAAKGAPTPLLRPTWECSAWGTGMAEQCVAALSEPEAAVAAKRVDRLLKQLPTFAEIAEEERRYRIATMHEALTRGVSGEISSTPTSPLELWGGRLKVLWAPKPVHLAAVEREYAAFAAYSQKSWPERRRTDLPVQRFVRERMDRVADACAGTEARLRLLRLELALQSQQRRTGTFPGTLQELQGLPDAAVRQDPFADGPFRYQRTNTGYRLYSCGRDGADHGGDPQRDLSSGNLANWRQELSTL